MEYPNVQKYTYEMHKPTYEQHQMSHFKCPKKGELGHNSKPSVVI